MRSPSLFISSGDPLLDRRFEWADGMLARNEAYAAAELLEDTLSRAPHFIAGWFLLASARENMNDRHGATEAYRRALNLDPADRLGASLRLARLGERGGKGAMPPAYVRTLFDQYAARFDNELRGSLHYRGPDLLLAAIEETLGADCRFARVLDLGCGTGLAGQAVRKKTEELIGVDLSPAMIATAGKKGVYDRLVVDDLVSFLAAEEHPFNLILAADVFVYVDDLVPIMRAAAARLAPAGAFAFTVETYDGEDVILRGTLRYAHGERHLRRAAEAGALTIAHLANVSTRTEKNLPVEGLLAVLRAAP